jgi:CDP-diacylglycerol--glycerol-3-phosphate 3-phosphatidyltransferase
MIYVPTIVSFLRIILTPVYLYFFWLSGFGNWTIAMIVFTIAALTDSYDGYLARRYKVESDLGAFVDPLADKILIGSAFISLVIKGATSWWVVGIIMSRDFLVTFLRMRAIKKGLFLPTTWIAKAKTVVQFVALYVAFIGVTIAENTVSCLYGDAMMLVVQVVMLLVAMFTVYTGIDYIIKYRRLVS